MPHNKDNMAQSLAASGQPRNTHSRFAKQSLALQGHLPFLWHANLLSMVLGLRNYYRIAIAKDIINDYIFLTRVDSTLWSSLEEVSEGTPFY